MKISFRAKTYFTIVAILAIGLLCACASQAAEPTTPPEQPATPPEVTTTPPDEPVEQVNRVDVVYCHRPQRCPTCLCFEERIRYIMRTYFKEELESGKMTFGVYDIGDSKNSAIVKKYSAVGSQLFINTIKDGTDNIEDIQAIWDWKCRTDKAGFDRKVKDAIEQSFEEID